MRQPSPSGPGCSSPLYFLRPWKGSFSVSVDLLAGETGEVGGLLQRPIQPRRRDLEPRVRAVLDLEHVLQLTGDLLAVLDGDEFARRVAGDAVDVDTQQPASAELVRSVSTSS